MYDMYAVVMLHVCGVMHLRGFTAGWFAAVLLLMMMGMSGMALAWLPQVLLRTRM
jgi:hypothetical protein